MLGFNVKLLAFSSFYSCPVCVCVNIHISGQQSVQEEEEASCTSWAYIKLNDDLNPLLNKLQFIRSHITPTKSYLNYIVN